MTNEPTSSKLKKSIVNCRYCGKNTHWSINCPTKVNTEKEKSDNHNRRNQDRNQDGYKRKDENKERHSDKPSITGLKISDLDDSLSESEIRDHFDQFGKIINLFMLKSKKTNTFNGFFFITYSTQEENDNALVDIKRIALNYLIPTVEYAKPKY
jgi:ribosomal protein L44E